MKPFALAGLVFIVLGVLALAYQGITYTSRDTVLDIGPLHATAERQHTVPLSPVLGIIAIIGGAALLFTAKRTLARGFHEHDSHRRPVLLLVGAIPAWPHSRGWGYSPSGGLGLILIVLLVLMLTGRL